MRAAKRGERFGEDSLAFNLAPYLCCSDLPGRVTRIGCTASVSFTRHGA